MKTEELIEILKQYPGAEIETQCEYATYTTEIREEDIEYDEGANAVVITSCH